MGRIAASISIVKASWGVLRRDRSLIALPLMSFAASAVTAALTLGIVMATRGRDPLSGQFRMSVANYVEIGVAYLVLAIVTIFFNAALISAANERMSGGDPTLDSALAGAMSRFGKLLPWAVVSATVSMILRQLRENSGLLGRIVVGFAGLAWGLVTFLVLPIIVVEGLSVRDAFKRSKHLFTTTWGEQFVGNAAIGIVAMLAIIAGLPVPVLAILTKATPVIVVGVGAFVVWVGAVAAVSTAMTGIFQTALYRYAATGELPTGFDSTQIESAFTARRPRRSLLG